MKCPLYLATGKLSTVITGTKNHFRYPIGRSGTQGVSCAFRYMIYLFHQMGSQETLEQSKQDEERRHAQALSMMCAAEAVLNRSLSQAAALSCRRSQPFKGKHLIMFSSAQLRSESTDPSNRTGGTFDVQCLNQLSHWSSCLYDCELRFPFLQGLRLYGIDLRFPSF